MSKRKREEAELEAKINPGEVVRKMRGEQRIADIDARSDDEDDSDFEPEGGKDANGDADGIQPQLVRHAKLRPQDKLELRNSARNFAKIGHFASGHSTGYAKSGHFGTQPRTLWYPAQDTTAPDTLRECLAPLAAGAPMSCCERRALPACTRCDCSRPQSCGPDGEPTSWTYSLAEAV